MHFPNHHSKLPILPQRRRSNDNAGQLLAVPILRLPEPALWHAGPSLPEVLQEGSVLPGVSGVSLRGKPGDGVRWLPHVFVCAAES